MTITDRHQRRGTMLFQLVLAIAFTGLLLTLGVRVITGAWKLESATQKASKERRGYDQLIQILSRDLESAGEVNVTRRIVLLDKHLMWKVSDRVVTRRTETDLQTWELDPIDATFTKTNYGILLSVEEKPGQYKRLPIVKTRDWSMKAVNR